jgi:hypothetical protein
MWVGSAATSYGPVRDERTVQAYNEEAFRHFLSLERKRSERASRSFVLVLVSLRTSPGETTAIAPALAARLFAGLGECVREIDFVGWFRRERVAGAVLIQGPATPAPEATRRIGDRVTAALRRRLPSRIAPRLHVRVLHRVGA